MSDSSTDRASGLTSPALHAFAIVPADDSDFSLPTRGLYVGGGGTLVLTMIGGETVSFVAVGAGTILPVRARRVLQTGTTATDIVGLT